MQTTERRPISTRQEKFLSGGNPVRRFLGILGPGLITGAADDDPSGIGTYSAAGASLGLATLWTALITFPLMATVQYICAKIGIVTGVGLAGVIRKHYPRWLLLTIVSALFVANTINAGADIGAMAEAIHLFLPLPMPVLVAATAAIIIALQCFGTYELILRVFKWLAIALFAYVIAGIDIRPDWPAVLKATAIPTLHHNPLFLTTLVAVLGTTISPYLFFWQTNHEVEQMRSEGKRSLWQRRGANKVDLKIASIDVATGAFFSNLVMYFIILTTAQTLYKAGITHITTATQAAAALRPLAGNFAYLLFAFGIIGTGFIGVPVLCGSAAYAFAETFAWKSGLDKHPRSARRFYGVIVMSAILGAALNAFDINPMEALFYTAVINGVLAPFLLVLIMAISNNKAIMGEMTNSPLVNMVGWGATLLMFAAVAGLFVQP